MYKTINFSQLFYIVVSIFLLFQNGCSGDQAKNAKSIEKAGDSYLDKGDFQKAIEKYSEAIDLDSNNSLLLRSRAFAYFLTGNYDQAIEDHKAALILDPDNPDIHGSIGLAFIAKNDIKSGIYHLGNGINLSDNTSYNDSILYWNRGIAYERIANCQRAINDYKNSLINASEGGTQIINDRIAWILATCPDNDIRNGVKALEMVSIEGGKEISHMEYRTLAAAFAETGNFKRAVKNQELAIFSLKQWKVDNVPNQEDKDRKLISYAKQLKAYKNNRPWRLDN